MSSTWSPAIRYATSGQDPEDARQDLALARGDSPRGNQVPDLLQALHNGRVLAWECGVADDPLRGPDQALEIGGWRSGSTHGEKPGRTI